MPNTDTDPYALVANSLDDNEKENDESNTQDTGATWEHENLAQVLKIHIGLMCQMDKKKKKMYSSVKLYPPAQFVR